MIINIPSKSDFENVAQENLTQAFTLLFKVYDSCDPEHDAVVSEEVLLEDVWEHHKGTLRTAIILLHQSIEGLMKAVICETSPLLLIDKPKKDWPTLPLSEDRDFDALYTIGGEALLHTFCAVPSGIKKTASLINFVEEIRQLRNQGIHGTNINNVTPEFIIENILKTFTIWFGPDSWHKALRNNLVAHPLFGYYDPDYESAISYQYLDFSMIMIGISKLSEHFSMDIKARSYFCPECKRSIESLEDNLESKWAFLNPNTPESSNILCLNCNESFEVVRRKCNINSCKGNVLFDDPDYRESFICLTCFETHDYKID